MSNPLSPEDLRDIQESIVTCQKIHAIKLYRERTGVGLKEAKDAIEDLERKLRSESPERFKAAEEIQHGEATESSASRVRVSKGCFGMLAILVGLAGTVLLLLAAITFRG